jgi:hypothetical protein
MEFDDFHPVHRAGDDDAVDDAVGQLLDVLEEHRPLLTTRTDTQSSCPTSSPPQASHMPRACSEQVGA